jgi:hypothetical protein
LGGLATAKGSLLTSIGSSLLSKSKCWFL